LIKGPGLLTLFILASLLFVPFFSGAEEAAEILNVLEGKFSGMETLRVDVSRRTLLEDQELTDSWEYIYKKPDKLKVLYKGKAGGLLVTDGEQIWQHLPQRKKAAVYSNIKDMPEKDRQTIFNKVFGPVTLVGLRIGLPEEILRMAELSFEGLEDLKGRSAWVILIRPEQKATGYTRIWIDRKRYCLLKSEVYSADDDLQSSIRASRFEEVSRNIWFPTSLRLFTWREGKPLETELDLSNIRFNKKLNDIEFTFTPPEGTDIIRL